MMGGYGMMAGMSGFGMFLVGLLVVAVIALVIWGFMVMSRAERNMTQPDAQETLRRRFARGELNREEFEQARAALR